MTRDEREAKLPAWAREELRNARHRAAVAQARLAEHLKTVDPTNIWYGEYRNPVYVPNQHGHQRVYFTLNGAEQGDTYHEIQVGIKGDGIEIMGGRSVVVRATASNALLVKLDDQ